MESKLKSLVVTYGPMENKSDMFGVSDTSMACICCNKRFVEWMDFRSHMQMKHRLFVKEKAPVCFKCKSDFKTVSDYHLHQEKCPVRFKIEECLFCGSNGLRDFMLAHTATHHLSDVCAQHKHCKRCNKTFETDLDFLVHAHVCTADVDYDGVDMSGYEKIDVLVKRLCDDRLAFTHTCHTDVKTWQTYHKLDSGPVEYDGSPIVFSHGGNKFAAAGCGYEILRHNPDVVIKSTTGKLQSLIKLDISGFQHDERGHPLDLPMYNSAMFKRDVEALIGTGNVLIVKPEDVNSDKKELPLYHHLCKKCAPVKCTNCSYHLPVWYQTPKCPDCQEDSGPNPNVGSNTNIDTGHNAGPNTNLHAGLSAVSNSKRESLPTEDEGSAKRAKR